MPDIDGALSDITGALATPLPGSGGTGAATAPSASGAGTALAPAIGGAQAAVAPPTRFDDALADLSKTPDQLRAEMPAPPLKEGGVVRNIGAGANDAIASTLGAPVDAATWALNEGARGINALAGTSLPDITAPVGGSDSIKTAMGWLGADPRNVGINGTADQIARGTGSGIVGMVAPTMAARGAAAALAPGIAQGIASAMGDVGLPTAAAMGGTSGGAGAAASAAVPAPYKPLANEAAQLVAGGAVGGAAALGRGAVDLGVNAGRNLVGPFVPSMARGLAADKLASGATDLPAVQAALASGQSDEFVPGSAPTTYQLTGDSGLGQMERAARTANPAPFIDRGAQQNAAQVGAVQGAAPENANPVAVGDLFRRQLSAIDAAGDQNVQFAKQNAQQAFDATGGTAPPDVYGGVLRDQMEAAKKLTKQRESQLWQAIDPDGTLTINATPVAGMANQLIKEMTPEAKPMDPEEKAIFGAAQMQGAAQPFQRFADLRSRLNTAIRAEVGTNGQTPAWRRMVMLRGAMDDTMTGAVDGVAQQQAQAVSTGTMSPEQTMLARFAQKAQSWYGDQNAAVGSGNDSGAPIGRNAGSGPQAVSRMAGAGGQAGRQPGGSPGNTGVPGQAPAVAPQIGDVVQWSPGGIAQLPRPQPVTGFSPDGRFAFVEGSRTGLPVGELSVTGRPPAAETQAFDADAAARYRAAASATKARAQTFNNPVVGPALQERGGFYPVPDTKVPQRFMGSAPATEAFTAAGAQPQTMQDALVADLRSKATNPDGTLNTAKYQTWLNGHGQALQSFPALQQQLGDAVTAQQAVDGAAATAKANLGTYQQSAARHFLGAEPRQAVQAAFGSKTPSNDFAQLSQLVAGDPDAKAGLQKAIVDHMLGATQSTRPAGDTGIAELNPAAFQKYLAKNRPAMSWVFSPDQLAGMDAVAADLQRANLSISGSKIPGQSNTAQDLASATTSLLGSVARRVGGAGVGYALGGLHGAIEGMMGGEAANAIRRAGLDNVNSLVEDALLNPDRARALLSNYSPRNAPFIAARLKSAYGTLGASASAQNGVPPTSDAQEPAIGPSPAQIGSMTVRQLEAIDPSTLSYAQKRAWLARTATAP